MKTKMLKSFFLAFSLMMLITGCSKTDDAVKSDFIANAGAIHNQLLDHYYQNRVNPAPGADELISEVVSLSSDYLLSMGYDQKTVLEAESQLEENYSSSNLKSVMDNDYSIDAGLLTAQFEDMELYSAQFIENVGEVLSRVEDEADLEALVSHINADFATIAFDNEADRDGQSLFVNIFNSSLSYWTGDGASNLKYLELDDNTKVIINDGIGGILGLIFGPAGSIITATAFSVATNEELKDD